MAARAPSGENDANNNGPPSPLLVQSVKRWQKTASQHSLQQEPERVLPRFVFDPDSAKVCYWTATVSLALLYNVWTIALRIAFPEMRQTSSCLPFVDGACDLVYLLDIFVQLRTAYLQDGIPVFDPGKIRQQYLGQRSFVRDVVSVLPTQTLLTWLPESLGYCKYFLCSAGAARLTKLLKFHVLYKCYNLGESFTSNPHLIRVLRLFLNLAIIIHWIACLYYLLSEYEGLGSNDWVYTNSTDQQRFSRKYIICLYWSAMTLTTIGNTNNPETDVEYIFTGVIFMTGVFVFATVMGNVGDVISSMNANRQEFQARMDHIQMYLTHKKVPASLQLKIKKWAEYTWSRTKATDESRLLNMLPERLRAEVAVHVHLDSLKKVKIFEQCETGFLCELVLKLRSQVFSPGDYVCRVGETGREMFIINHGKVEVIVNNPATNNPMVVAILNEGNYFGEISLLRLDGVQNRRTADVRSIGYSELLCLSRRDLMAALVEYPEAKSVLEDQAKKRMKTSLQAQRAFSVDTLLRNSQSSVDSGIVKEEAQDVSEIKAMIEELKNANKVPGKTVWQLIARCEVLQAKLGEKEREVLDSRDRIRELEQLLFSHHYPRYRPEPTENLLEPDPVEKLLEPDPAGRLLKPGMGKVIKQFSQDEGRRVNPEFPGGIPEVKITNPNEIRRFTEENGSEDDGIQMSRLTDVHTENGSRLFSSSTCYRITDAEKGSSYDKATNNRNNQINPSIRTSEKSRFGSNDIQDLGDDGYDQICRSESTDAGPNRDETPKIPSGVFERKQPDALWNNLCPQQQYTFTNETLIEHFSDGVSVTFREEFHDAIEVPFGTIPEDEETCSSLGAFGIAKNERHTCDPGIANNGERHPERLDLLRMASFNSDDTNSRRSSCCYSEEESS